MNVEVAHHNEEGKQMTGEVVLYVCRALYNCHTKGTSLLPSFIVITLNQICQGTLVIILQMIGCWKGIMEDYKHPEKKTQKKLDRIKQQRILSWDEQFS